MLPGSAQSAGRAKWSFAPERALKARRPTSAPSASNNPPPLAPASKVAEVRTSVAHGKQKRQGQFVGRRSDWKKAYVVLKKGEKLPEFVDNV